MPTRHETSQGVFQQCGSSGRRALGQARWRGDLPTSPRFAHQDRPAATACTTRLPTLPAPLRSLTVQGVARPSPVRNTSSAQTSAIFQQRPPFEESGMSASAVRPKRPASSSSTGSPAVKSKTDGASDESSNPETAARTLAGFNGNRRVPPPVNEPVKSYAPGSPERAALKDRLRSMSDERADIPLIIGGTEMYNWQLWRSVMPHNHRHVLAQWHRAGAENIDQAITAAKHA